MKQLFIFNNYKYFFFCYIINLFIQSVNLFFLQLVKALWGLIGWRLERRIHPVMELLDRKYKYIFIFHPLLSSIKYY